MSEEEKAVIETFKNTYWYTDEGDLENGVNILLKLIEKQAKEIKELKEQLNSFIVGAVKETYKNTAKNLDDLDLLNRGWKEEVKLKDKIIDEMALYILRHNYYDTTEFDKNTIPTIENTKQYFINKVKKNK